MPLSSLIILGAFASLAVALASLLRLAGWGARDRPLALALGIACAPALAGLSLFPFFLLGWQPAGPGYWPFLLALAMLLPGRSGAPGGVWQGLRQDVAVIGGVGWRSIMVALALLALALVLLSLPLIENDALEYASIARFLAREGNLLHYPVVSPDLASGLYAPSLHPPLFHLALVWGQAWLGDDVFMAQRLIAVWSCAGATLVVGAIALRASKAAALWSMLMLAGIPFWLSSVVSYGVDPMRIAVFTAALGAVLVAAETPSLPRTVSAGLVTALAVWIHAIGVLTPVFGAAALFLCAAKAERWRTVSLYLVVVAIFGSGWLLRNLWLHGNALGDDWPAANWPILGYQADLAVRRGLAGVGDQIRDGMLRPWSDPALFGLTFWLALAAVPLWWGGRRSDADTLALVVVGGFLALALAGILAGSLLVIKNPRYVLTVAPFAALAAGLAAARLAQAGTLPRLLVRSLLALSLVWTAANLGIRLYGAADIRLALSGDERGFLSRPRVTGGPLLAMLPSLEPGRVLSFRPPDVAIYGGRPWLDHFDPRMETLHSGSTEAAAAWLAAQDVRFAVVPDYTPVTYTRSALGLLLADPRWAEPLAAHRDARLFRLHGAPVDVDCKAQPLDLPQIRERQRGWGDALADLTRIPQLARILPGSGPTTSAGTSLSWSASVDGDVTVLLRQPFEGRFSARLQVSGNGVFAVHAMLTGPGGRGAEMRLLDTLADGTPRIVAAQWRTDPGEAIIGLRLVPVAPRAGRIRLESAALCRVES